jgi:xanthine/uracil/vitamin C permease (AzgA family)
MLDRVFRLSENQTTARIELADGLALGFVAYPLVKLAAGQGRDVKPLMYLIAAMLAAYLAFVRVLAG